MQSMTMIYELGFFYQLQFCRNVANIYSVKYIVMTSYKCF